MIPPHIYTFKYIDIFFFSNSNVVDKDVTNINVNIKITIHHKIPREIERSRHMIDKCCLKMETFFPILLNSPSEQVKCKIAKVE